MNNNVHIDDNSEDNQAAWRFFDGSIAVSASMLVAVLISKCVFCEYVPIIHLLKSLADQEEGIIIVATIILFPTTLTLYGGWKMYFAAKQAYERRKQNWVRELKEEERKRILSKLEQKGEQLSKDEVVRLISED